MVGVAFIDRDLMQDACNKVAIVAVFQFNTCQKWDWQQPLFKPKGARGSLCVYAFKCY